MSSAAAALLATRPARRLPAWAWRLGLFLAVQALIALACVILLRQPAPEPPARWRLVQAMLRDGAGERPVALPHHQPKGASPALYTLGFDWTPPTSGEAWSVLLPRFMNAVEVAVNGAVVLDSRRDPAANRIERNTPEIQPIPLPLLHEGANRLTIRLFAGGPLSGFLDRVYVGPDTALRPAYERRVLLFQTLPIVFSAWQAILAVILGIMWLKRRQDVAYGILAIAMVLGVVNAYVYAAAGQSLFAGLNAVLVASAPLESACVLLFVVTFLGFRWPAPAWLVFAPGAAIVLLGLTGDPALIRSAYLFLVPPTVGACLIACFAVIARAAMLRFDPVAVWLGAGIAVAATCCAYDVGSILGVLPDSRIFVSRLSYSALLVAIGAGLTWRFANALNEVDGFATRMVGLVREAEDKLRASLVHEQERARVAALADERNRLMRDLHDGLGGQLVSIVALSERGQSERIREAARSALRDLRLVIDAMDDIEGDLMLALAVWRERTEAQLRPHGISLDWHVLSPEGLPLHAELRPWHVIQVLRLLDEAVTNAIKHAQAERVTVTIETVPDATGSHGRITVADDGQGFAPAGEGRVGRGLANMRQRAARCGATLDIATGSAGTRVRLDLPKLFPAAESQGG